MISDTRFIDDITLEELETPSRHTLSCAGMRQSPSCRRRAPGWRFAECEVIGLVIV